jgi:hypothetical protein
MLTWIFACVGLCQCRYDNGDHVGVMVDFVSAKVAFFLNGTLVRTVNGVNITLNIVPLVSLGANDVSATVINEPPLPETPREMKREGGNPK